MLEIGRSNTILYCDDWAAVAGFYRDVLGLEVVFANDWFVEFALGGSGFLSVVAAERTSITAGDGRGLTLSWQVPDVAAARQLLLERGVPVSSVIQRFGSPVVDLHDPAGNRIELWSD